MAYDFKSSSKLATGTLSFACNLKLVLDQSILDVKINAKGLLFAHFWKDRIRISFSSFTLNGSLATIWTEVEGNLKGFLTQYLQAVCL